MTTNIKGSYNNNTFEISAATWNEKFDLPDGFHSVPDIQDYFEHGENIKNPSTRIYVNRIVNRITF